MPDHLLDTAVLALGNMLQNLLLPIGLVLILLSLMLSVRKRRRRAANPITPREHIERSNQQRGLRDDLERLMVEIEEMAKRLGAHLDAKSIHLERLLHDADERIAELKKLNGQPTAARPPAAASAARDEPTAAVKTSGGEPSGGDPLARSVYQLADQGLDPHAIARKLDEHVGKVELILALRGE